MPKLLQRPAWETQLPWEPEGWKWRVHWRVKHRNLTETTATQFSSCFLFINYHLFICFFIYLFFDHYLVWKSCKLFLSFSVFLCCVGDTFGPHTARLRQPLENWTCLGGRFSRRGRHPDKERLTWLKITLFKCDLTALTFQGYILISCFSGNFQQRQTPSVWVGFCPSIPPSFHQHTCTHTQCLPRPGFCWNTNQ